MVVNDQFRQVSPRVDSLVLPFKLPYPNDQMFIPSAFKELTNCVSTNIGNKTPRAEVLPSVTPPGIGQLLLFIAALGFALPPEQEVNGTAMPDREPICP